MARRLEVEIIGDASSLKRELAAATGHTSRFGGALGGLAKAGVFAAGAAGIGGLFVTLKEGIADFTESSKVAAQTAAVIKSTGGSANITAKQVDRLAGSISAYSGIDDEAIASGENMLLTFTNIRNETGKGNDVFNQSTKILTDMSVALGTDMPKSAIQLGKALNDPIRGLTALRRVGVSFTEAQEDQIKAMVESGNTMGAQKLILAELNKEFGGSAKAAGDTLPGQLNKLRNAFANMAGDLIAKALPALTRFANLVASEILPRVGELFERIGKAAGPALAALGDMLMHVATVLRRNWPQIREVFQNLGEIIQNLWKIAEPILRLLFEKVLPTAIRVALPVLKLLSEALVAITDVIATTIAAVAEGISAIAATISGLPGNISDFSGALLSTFTEFFGRAGLAGWVSGRISEFAATITSLPSKIGDFSKTLLSTFSKFFTSAGIGGWVSGKVKEFADFVTGIPGRISDFGANLAERFKHFFTGAQIGAWLVEKVGEFAGKFSDLPGKIGGAVGDAMHFLKEKLTSLFNWRKIVGWIKDALGFGSPSPFFMAIGGDIVDSMARGVGAAANVLKDAVVDLAKKYVLGPAQAAIGAVGQVISPGGLPSGNTLDLLQLFARSQGIAITSAMREGPREASFHNVGRAIDVSGSAGQMRDFFRAAIGHFGVSNIAELFYDPMGYYVDNNRSPLGPPGGGRMYRGAIGGHSDHVHIALAKGGIVTAPTVALLGEHGREAVIPLNRGGIAPIVNVYVAGSVMTERDLTTSIRDELVRMGKRNGGGMLGGLG